MQRTKQKHRHPREMLRIDLLSLYDSVAEFSDQCAFLCDAFAAIPSYEETIDPATARGMRLSAQWMKGKVQKIQLDLKKIHEQAGKGLP